MTLITTRILVPQEWPTLAQVLGPDGGSEGCWCVSHRFPPCESTPTGQPAQDLLRQLVQDNKAHGVVALVDGKPAGWCAVDPRDAIPGHDCTPPTPELLHPGTWSLHCLYVRREHRGRGVSQTLIQAAIELARGYGADELEAYPAELGRGLDFAGSIQLFLNQGFSFIGPAVGPYSLARLSLRPTDARA